MWWEVFVLGGFAFNSWLVVIARETQLNFLKITAIFNMALVTMFILNII